MLTYAELRRRLLCKLAQDDTFGFCAVRTSGRPKIGSTRRTMFAQILFGFKPFPLVQALSVTALPCHLSRSERLYVVYRKTAAIKIADGLLLLASHPG